MGGPPVSAEGRGDWYSESFDELYPILYAHRDEAEAERLLDRLAVSLHLNKGRTLDLGCGQGRHLRALTNRGARAVGLDLSEPLLGIARRDLPDVPLVRGDMRRLPFCVESFHAVLMMFTTFGYFQEDMENAAVLSGVAAVLVPDGVFLLDYVNAGHARTTLVPLSERTVEGHSVEEKRWCDPAGRFLYKETRVRPLGAGGERIYRERLRLYESEEIESMALRAGLQVDRLLGDYDGGSFDRENSPRLMVLAHRSKATP